ncbi:hypothetical protein HY629_02350 [Candidatus Uhrbacteria bacterium]|nr:hypothetical protein [Candidatus Uhrbacteria bacterium]
MSVELSDSRTSQDGVRPELHFPMCSCHRDGLSIKPFSIDGYIRYPVFRTIVTRFLDELFEAGKGKGRWEEDGWDITVGHRSWVVMLKREGKVVYIERTDLLAVLLHDFFPGSWDTESIQYQIGLNVHERLRPHAGPWSQERTMKDRTRPILDHVGLNQ